MRKRLAIPMAWVRGTSSGPQRPHRALDHQGRGVGDDPGGPAGPLAELVAGTTSLTSPTSRARSADRRSWAPRSDRRMISWNGILDSIWIGSNAAVIP